MLEDLKELSPTRQRKVRYCEGLLWEEVLHHKETGLVNTFPILYDQGREQDMHDLGFMTGVTFSVGMRVELSSQQSGCL